MMVQLHSNYHSGSMYVCYCMCLRKAIFRSLFINTSRAGVCAVSWWWYWPGDDQYQSLKCKCVVFLFFLKKKNKSTTNASPIPSSRKVIRNQSDGENDGGGLRWNKSWNKSSSHSRYTIMSLSEDGEQRETMLARFLASVTKKTGMGRQWKLRCVKEKKKKKKWLTWSIKRKHLLLSKQFQSIDVLLIVLVAQMVQVKNGLLTCVCLNLTVFFDPRVTVSLNTVTVPFTVPVFFFY